MNTAQSSLLYRRKLVELQNLRWLLTRPNQSVRKRQRQLERLGKLITELRRKGIPIPNA